MNKKIRIEDKEMQLIFDQEKETLLIRISSAEGASEIILKKSQYEEVIWTLISALFKEKPPIDHSNRFNLNSILDDSYITSLKLDFKRDYYHFLHRDFDFNITGNNEKEKAEVFIGIPQEDINLFAIEAIQNACGDFMEALGFELETQDEPVYGSFFQRLKFVLKSDKTKSEVKDIYNKGKQALEAQHLNLPTAEATEKLANAASRIIEAMANIDEGVLRLGAILVVKVQREGKPIVLAETVSPALASTLDNNPRILKNPNAIYELLISEKESQEQIGEAEGAEVPT